jgi:hypothetical protein
MTAHPAIHRRSNARRTADERVADVRRAFEEAGIEGPDTFIVGAPKCGTTSLNASLAAHPDVFMARKESHYFGADFDRTRIVPEGYAQLFAAGSAAERRGEASVWYLASRSAPEEIHAFAPDARIFIMLRDPVEMIRSLHGQLMKTGVEHITDLRAAIAAEPERREGRMIKGAERYRFREQFLYTDAVDYVPQVTRYFEVFGRDRVQVILFDDLRNDPGKVMRDAQAFLGVRVDPDLSLLHENPAGAVRSIGAQRVLRRYVVRPMRRLTRSRRVAAKVLPAKVRQRMRPAALQSVNRRPSDTTPPMDPELRLELASRFRPGVLELQDLLGRDLSSWTPLTEQGAR